MMPLFDESEIEETAKKEQDEQNRQAMHAMSVFSDDAEKADVIAVCDDLTRIANELAELLDLEPSPAILAMLVGAGLQRAQVVQARNEQAEQKTN